MGKSDPPLLTVRKVTKKFPGVIALRDVDLTLKRGEVLAVIGENGAGKSTLMKILAGVQQADSGEIEFHGKPLNIRSVHDAIAQGIALIHQELNLSGNLPVGANIFLGREPRIFGWIRDQVIRDRASEYLDNIGLDVDPRTLAGGLTIGQQQMVEIAKALSVDAQIVIMDEPTSSLTQTETQRLFETIDQLRDSGVSIIYISHRMAEVERVADRVLVLRDGENAGELSRSEISHDAMIQLMVGRQISQFFGRDEQREVIPPDAVPTLSVCGLRTTAFPSRTVDLSVHAGEIVGIAGLVGAGRSELLSAIFGFELPIVGEIRIDGTSVSLRSCQNAIAAGMALVPEDRKQQGVILQMAVRQNISLASLRRNRRPLGFLNFRVEHQQALNMTDRLKIKTPSQEQTVQFLSGGNQQKVVLGKWLALKPKILLLDEPTRGIDVGAKQEIYRLMNQLAEQGVALLFVSGELEEIIGMSDRCLVMYQGQITGEILREDLTEESIMQLATGKSLATA